MFLDSTQANAQVHRDIFLRFAFDAKPAKYISCSRWQSVQGTIDLRQALARNDDAVCQGLFVIIGTNIGIRLRPGVVPPHSALTGTVAIEHEIVRHTVEVGASFDQRINGYSI